MSIEIGARFGKLTVLESAQLEKGFKMSRCECECGKVLLVRNASLTYGTTRSCGCLHREIMSTHNLTGTPEYRSWASMKSRCNNPKDPSYPRYGGRGIRVCDRWNESFEDFLADMGQRPSLDHSIDRENVDGPYDVNNCRWATSKEQGNNRRNNVRYDVDGQMLTVPEAARLYGANLVLVKLRVRRGWSLKDAVTRPVRR